MVSAQGDHRKLTAPTWVRQAQEAIVRMTDLTGFADLKWFAGECPKSETHPASTCWLHRTFVRDTIGFSVQVGIPQV